MPYLCLRFPSYLLSAYISLTKKEDHMEWTPPSFVEVKMDAEINSYQDDFRDSLDVKERSEDQPVISTRQD
jgi:hypothetical protein